MNILITGCSSGIGLDAALTLVNKGYRVFATVRNQQDSEELLKSGVEVYTLDITDYSSVDRMVQDLLQKTDHKLDVLFHNAAYGQVGALEDITVDVLKQQFETNVFAWHYLTNKFLPHMMDRNQGRIIYNSSVLGLVSMPYRGPYNASKYAIEGLADTLRLELLNTNIHVSLIEPGPIKTRFRDNALKKLKENIDLTNSRYASTYQQQIERLGKDIANQFTLPPSAVTKKLLHAIESRRPKAHYHVTFPTHLFATLKRALPSTWLDRLLVKG